MPDERDKYDVLHGGWEAPASEVAQARARGVPAKGVAPGGGVLGFARVALLATLLSVSARNPRLRKGVLFSSRLSSFVNGVQPEAPVVVADSEEMIMRTARAVPARRKTSNATTRYVDPLRLAVEAS